MANGELLDKNISADAFKGYIVRILEDIQTNNKNQSNCLKEVKNDITKINNDIEEIKDENKKNIECRRGFSDLRTVIYGDSLNKQDGLLTEVKKLKLSHKIKSGFYGLLGGGGMSAIMVLMYFLLRGKL